MGYPARMRALLVLLLACAPAAAEDDLVHAHNYLRKKIEAAKAERGPDRTWPYARLPAWELGAVVAQEGLSVASSPLTEREKAIARWVFGEGTIDLDAVRVARAPSPTGAPMAWGNTIRMPSGYKLSTGTLAHELTHVWQYQTSGTEYVSDSFLKQACAFLVDGDREEAYRYSVAEGASFFSYGAEQQAEIVEAWAVSKKKRDDARYRRLLAEMRARKAGRFTRESETTMMEKDAGLPSRRHAVPPGPAGEPKFNGEAGGVPQFELRF